MPDAASSPSQFDETGAADGWERALLDRQLEALGRLADMGLAIAGAIERRATADPAGPASEAIDRHAAMDFARVSRAVRLTYALQSSLVADFKGRRGSRSAGPDDAPCEGPFEVVWDEPPGEDERRQVRKIVRRVAVAAGLDREAVERLACKAAERLERDDIYDVLNRPTGEIVALICQDLGLEPDWDQFAGEAWAQAEIAARPPGSPFAAWKARQAHGSPPPLVPSG